MVPDLSLALRSVCLTICNFFAVWKLIFEIACDRRNCLGLNMVHEKVSVTRSLFTALFQTEMSSTVKNVRTKCEFQEVQN